MAAVLLAAVSLPGTVGTGARVAVPTAARGMQWGLWEPTWQRNDGSADFTQVTHMETELGHHDDLMHWFASWNEDWSYDGPLVQQAISLGHIPLITWEAHDRSLAAIANGDYDPYIDSWAQGMAKQAPKQVDLRIFHEFNDPYQGGGSGYTWGVNGGTANTPADLVAAWRHIHDRFIAAGAMNVRFIWCPDGANATLDLLRASYPGDGYVDYAGWDQYGYNIDQIYQVLGQVTQKPLMVPEYGETSAAAVTDLSTRLNAGQYGRVRALVSFDDKSWRLDNLPDVRTAVQQMLAGSAFAPPPPPTPTPSPSTAPSAVATG